PGDGEVDERVRAEREHHDQRHRPQHEDEERRDDDGPGDHLGAHQALRLREKTRRQASATMARHTAMSANDIAAPPGQLKRVENSMAMNWPSIVLDGPPRN